MEKNKMQLIKTSLFALILYFGLFFYLSVLAQNIDPVVQWNKKSDQFSEGGTELPSLQRFLGLELKQLKASINLDYLGRNITDYSEFHTHTQTSLGYKLLEYKTKIKLATNTQESKIYHGVYILKNNRVIGYYLVENYAYEKNQPLVEARVAQIEQLPLNQVEINALTLYPNIIDVKIYQHLQNGYIEKYALASVSNSYKQLMLEAWYPVELEPVLKSIFVDSLQQNITFTYATNH
jgi:hypothetical protein